MLLGKRGRSFTYYLRPVAGSGFTFDGSETVTALLKKATANNLPPADSVAGVSLTAAFIAAAGADPAMWALSLTGPQTAALDRAVYVTDAKVIKAAVTLPDFGTALVDMRQGVTP